MERSSKGMNGMHIIVLKDKINYNILSLKNHLGGPQDLDLKIVLNKVMNNVFLVFQL